MRLHTRLRFALILCTAKGFEKEILIYWLQRAVTAEDCFFVVESSET